MLCCKARQIVANHPFIHPRSAICGPTTIMAPTTCSFCKKKISKQRLSNKKRRIHAKQCGHDVYQCPCETVFLNYPPFLAHCTMKHPGLYLKSKPETLFSCSLCPDIFVFQDSLTQHEVQTHGKWVQCPKNECSVKFHDWVWYQQHRIRTGHDQ
ncbi:hypothetical protein C8Q75DRAFT_113943 [Abortiporus biennis]|nr:hypothetical protein C8Q75DRAFT_113943 [Abortiporus biennis]